jgi:glycosyltransferase involved in cell wall biosynthesis
MPSHQVSVLMPAYNCEPYIDKAISSILKQTYVDIELIICDDGSTDLTWQVITSFKDSRIRAYQHAANKGYLATYNYLLSLVSGDFYTFQDADDWSEPNRIERQLAVLTSYPDCMVCACNGSFFYSDKIMRKCPPFNSGYIQLNEGNFEFMLPAVIYKSEILKRFNSFHAFFDRTTGGDQYYILEVLTQFKGYAINEYLYTARFNPTSNHRTLTSLRKLVASDIYFELKRQRVSGGTDWLLEGRIDLLNEYESKLLSDRSFLSEKYREYAVYRIDANQIQSGVKLLITSLFYWPFNWVIYRTFYYALRKLLSRI